MEKVVLFDGDCNFCNRSVLFLLHRDKRRIFKFAHLRSPAGRKILHEMGIAQPALSGDGGTVVFIDEGKAYVRSDAALQAVRYLGGWWPWMIGFKIVPKFVRDAVYGFIADIRHKLVKTTCRVPDALTRSRFLPDGLTITADHEIKSTHDGKEKNTGIGGFHEPRKV